MGAQAKTVLILVVAASVVGTGACLWLGHPVYWRSTDSIREHLLSRTPLGSRLSDVIADLERSGVTERLGGASLSRVTLETIARQPNHEIHVVVARYRVFFRVSVEAFYRFDPHGALVALEVRKTADTP